MRILLVEPPMQSIMLARADWLPMGLAYLAGCAIRENHEVIIYNGEHDPKLDYVNLTTYSSNYYRYLDALSNPTHPAWKKISKLMADFRPDLLGITSSTVKFPSAKRIAALGKDYNLTMPVVLGGQHATIMIDEVLSDPNIDFLIRGEGEETFIELLRQMEGGRDWAKIDGLSYKTNDRQVVHNKARALLSDLDTLAMPARQCLFEVKTYEPHALGKLFASRGCPYQCTYCGTQNVWTQKVRHHSANRVVEEIRQVKKEFGTTYWTFFDDVFGIDKTKTLELTRQIAEAKLNISWDCLTRANLVSDQLLIAMKKAGCTKIDMGVESGSEKILKDTKKGLTKDEIRAGAAIVKKHKFLLYMFFMIGLPTETEEDVKQTLAFLEELKPDWAGISIFTPIPGTALYKELRAQGKISDEPDYARFSHQSPHSNFAFGMLNREAFPALAKETIEYVQAYNGSFRNLFRRGLSRGYHHNPKLLLSDLKKVATWKGFLQAYHQRSHPCFDDKVMLGRE